MSEITIGKLRGGYCVSWHDAGQRRRYQLKARTRKAAEAEGRDRYLKEQSSSENFTIASLWAAYVDHLGDKPSAKTLGWTGKAVLAHFGALRPDQLTVADSRAYAAKRRAEGRKEGTIHTELSHLRNCVNWAHRKMGLIGRVPAIEVPSAPATDVRPLTDEEVQRIVSNCTAPHVRLAVILLMTTGGRVSSILDRQWEHIDFDRGVIDLRLTDGVTRKGRAVLPMNALARAALEAAYFARQTEYVIEFNGRPVKSIRTGYKAALRRAGLQGIRIHQIRHTVAVRMLAAGKPIELVSQYLGHSNTSVTQKVYARFLPEHLSDAADILTFGMTLPPTS